VTTVNTEPAVVAGYASYPPCEHGAVTHTVENDQDPLPLCTAPGCGCGRPPVGFRRSIDQRIFLGGDAVPAGVPVLGKGGRFYPAKPSAWFNVGHGPLVEVEPEVEDRRDAVRREYERVCHALSGVGLSLSMWSGRGDWATCSAASRDQAGTRAVRDLEAAIGQLREVHEELACAADPRLSGQVPGPSESAS
jgi:hypothetical protein